MSNRENLYPLDTTHGIDLREIAAKINLGFERESLRVTDSKISNQDHPKSLGSSGFNKFITTDFFEAQLELITPPLEGSCKSAVFLDHLQHFVQKNIDNEFLWPLSIPPHISSIANVPIARFGKSNQGMFKHIYRLGLEKRYGKLMQSISGFHFNYSLPKELWVSLAEMTSLDAHQIQNKVYFNILRNIFKKNWLLIYLFGASPVIEKIFLKNSNDSFINLDNDFAYLPYATSLRMSEHGYSNNERKRINISINSLNEYVKDLYTATITEDQSYLSFQEIENSQLNPNILQIEAEYYAVARAKNNRIDGKTASMNLLKGGVEFIEIRSLDLNPFSSLGIEQDAIYFLEIFILHCMLEECPKFNKEAMMEMHDNDISVAKYGRKPDLFIRKSKQNILMKDWALKILEKMMPIAQRIDSPDEEHSKAIESMRSKLEFPDQTHSASIIRIMKERKYTHNDLGNYYGNLYKENYLERKESENKIWNKLTIESQRSILEQRDQEEITLQSGINFKEYKEDFFNKSINNIF